jgi:hypothetical protein
MLERDELVGDDGSTEHVHDEPARGHHHDGRVRCGVDR